MQKRKRRPTANEASRNFQGQETNFGKLLLVYFMRPTDLEALGAKSPFGA